MGRAFCVRDNRRETTIMATPTAINKTNRTAWGTDGSGVSDANGRNTMTFTSSRPVHAARPSPVQNRNVASVAGTLR